MAKNIKVEYKDGIANHYITQSTEDLHLPSLGFTTEEDAELGFDNMKIIASQRKVSDRAKAQDAIKNGKSPDSVIAMMKKKAKAVDPKEKLEKERERLTKTINELTHRLEFVEESLANL